MSHPALINRVLASGSDANENAILLSVRTAGDQEFTLAFSPGGSQQAIAALAIEAGRLESSQGGKSFVAAPMEAQDALLAEREDGKIALNVILADGASLVFDLPSVALTSLFSGMDHLKTGSKN